MTKLIRQGILISDPYHFFICNILHMIMIIPFKTLFLYKIQFIESDNKILQGSGTAAGSTD